MSEGTETAAETTTAGAEVPVDVEPAVTTETAEAEVKPETPETEGEKGETEESEKPKRPSGYDRMKRKNQYLQSEILRLREEASKPAAADADKAPREEDFNGDWGKYIAATAAFEAAKAVKDTLQADKKTANESRVAELRSEVLSDFEGRTEAFKSKATDFDSVVSEYVNKGGKFSDAVRELVIESEVGPQLTYHLAKNPAIANKLNSLPPLQAAKEVARLEDTLSKPSLKPTNAPKPLTPVKGGASGQFDPTTASMEDYVAKRRAGWKG